MEKLTITKVLELWEDSILEDYVPNLTVSEALECFMLFDNDLERLVYDWDDMTLTIKGLNMKFNIVQDG